MEESDMEGGKGGGRTEALTFSHVIIADYRVSLAGHGAF